MTSCQSRQATKKKPRRITTQPTMPTNKASFFFFIDPTPGHNTIVGVRGEKTVHFLHERQMFFSNLFYCRIHPVSENSFCEAGEIGNWKLQEFGNFAPGITHLKFMLREPQASDIIYCILCICFLVVVVYIFLPFKIRGIFTYTPDYHIFRFTTNHKPPAKSTPCEWDMQEHGRWSWSNWRPPSYPLRALVQSVEAWRVFTAVKNLDEWMPKLMGQKESIGTLSGFKKLVASVCVCVFFFRVSIH